MRSRDRLASLALAALTCIFAVGCATELGNAPDVRDATGETAADGESMPLPFHPAAKTYIVRSQRSLLDVKGHDSVLGEHHLTFRRWWARIETDPLRLVVDIDLRSLTSDESLVVSVVRDHILEADRYPHATLVGSLTGTARHGEITVAGVADIHGRHVPLRFTGAIQPEGTGYRFKAGFDLSRRAFAFSFAPAEPFLDDTFHVSLDALATEERVEVQEVDQGG